MSNNADKKTSLNSGHKTREERVREIRASRGRAVKAAADGQDSKRKRSPLPHKAGLSDTSARRKRARRHRRRAFSVQRVLLFLVPLLILVLVGAFLTHRFAGSAGLDTTPPVITLRSNPDYTVMPGQTYQEEGFTATDDRDGDLTDRVERTVEENRICYRIADSAGNITVTYREIPYAPGSDPSLAKVFVQDVQDSDSSGEGGADAATAAAEGKVVYLTFDDGPGQYTQQLLNTLAKYDVHVTFFVTGAFPAYEEMIKKEFEAGHSIGIHTFSHDYDKIYASPDAFWKDNAQMQEVIVRQTGQASHLMRFAGGSSNTMGTWQSEGIMETLVNQAAGKGFQYFDWNVSSGDGAAEGDSAMVISRITDQIRNFDESVVLCHDTKEYTVNAMEYLIPWLLDNGYKIRPLAVDSTPAHHIDPD